MFPVRRLPDDVQRLRHDPESRARKVLGLEFGRDELECNCCSKIPPMNRMETITIQLNKTGWVSWKSSAGAKSKQVLGNRTRIPSGDGNQLSTSLASPIIRRTK